MTSLHRQAPTMPFRAFQQSFRRGGGGAQDRLAYRVSRRRLRGLDPDAREQIINGDGVAHEVNDVLAEQGGPLRAHQEVGSSH